MGLLEWIGESGAFDLPLCGAQGIGIQVEECDKWHSGGSGSSWSKTASGDEFDLEIKLIITDNSSPTALTDSVNVVVDITDY